MSENRPFILTIAGFDPSAGAGILADIKTFEQLKTYGIAIPTAYTIQTENQFIELEWVAIEKVLFQIELFLKEYKIKAIKIGIVSSLSDLKLIIQKIRNIDAKVPIIWDTVLKSTTEFSFLEIENQQDLEFILQSIQLITPNHDEVLKLIPNAISVEENLNYLRNHTAVLWKGGHKNDSKGKDVLLTKNKEITIHPTLKNCSEKHGSGCVLSSAITAHLSLDENLEEACKKAKLYTEKILQSNLSKLAYHV
ncbi:hydroxymethylpyrimidine/phosphomethylpyrimidine kinase [Flavobacterium terrigena]|uniref:hydroxymethylpyrimidine kinase n=1 Tax=Flavobacterium terrigena TaxID=402734 RepID=A0A1H6QQW0_9FLAO|nr:hydroxymethylpyrimidine/phosphomethylpyrimidine kinase [Flavobacterium terrigena]SEI46208.1 hydroxymethylpyrimidine/phosphomethylpyrimidine kinase [Flavobacterium terrigena]